MFANMQRLAVALLVVAFVPARVPAEFTDMRVAEYVSDLYSATSHTLVGSFNYTDEGYGLFMVDVNKALQFVSKYPYVAITLHRAEDVSPRCTIHGPALINGDGQPIAIYSGKDTGILNNSDFTVNLWTDGSDIAKLAILNSVVVLSSANAEDPKPSPIACGKIRHYTAADYFLGNYKDERSQKKLGSMTGLPSVSNRQISLFMLTMTEAVSDLYSSDSGDLVGSIIYRTIVENYLEVGVLDLSNLWHGVTVVALVYHSKDVMPGCVTTGPAVSIRDELNVTRPVTLFTDRIDILRKPTYGNVVDYASVSPKSDFDIMGRVVVLYAFKPLTPIVLEDFLQPTNPHTVIACGAIRSVDASEDNFLKWALAGPKPTPMSETKKRLQFIFSIGQRLRYP